MAKIIVTAAFIQKDNKFLIAQRKKGLHMEFLWELPGGKLENHESEIDCLRREMKEEFGVSCMVNELYHSNEHHYRGRDTIILRTYRVTCNEAIVHLNDHERVAWIAPEEAGNFEFAPADVPVIDKIRSEYSAKRV